MQRPCFAYWNQEIIGSGVSPPADDQGVFFSEHPLDPRAAPALGPFPVASGAHEYWELVRFVLLLGICVFAAFGASCGPLQILVLMEIRR